jgi:small GTP-binding protein
MASFKIVFLGNKGSGKTQLAKQLAFNNTKLFDPNSKPTVGVDFIMRTLTSENKLNLWDVSGDERYNSIMKVYEMDVDVGIYCVDLTEEIDEQHIKEKIGLYKKTNPNSPIILVGTKADEPKPNNIEVFNRIVSDGLFNKAIVSSAKDGTGVDELFSTVCSLYKDRKNSIWENAVRKLVNNLEHLPPNKKNSITEELEKLKKIVFANPKDLVLLDTKVKAIEDFSINCEVILEGKHAKVLKAVLAVAAAAAVTVLAGLLGFCIGFALGLWSGPGAFVTGIVAGNSAAVAAAAASTVLGLGAGGITAHRLFKKPKEMAEVQEFKSEIKPLYGLFAS